MKAIKKIFIFANILLFLASVMSYLAPYVNPTKAWIFPFFATAYFWLLVTNVLFIIFWVLFKNKLWLLSFFAILLGVQHIGSYITVSVDQSSSEDISIMTYNAGGAYSTTVKKTGEEYKKAFTDLIQSNDKPSILCLQESAYAKFYRDQLSYKNHQKVSGSLILTDFEIIDKGAIKFEESSNRIIWADMLVNENPIRVVNVHLQSNSVSGQTEDLVNNPDLAEKQTWVGMKSVISKIKHATKMRTSQALEAKQFIDDSPYPTLVVGDFNDTPLSYTYRQLAKNYSDAFIKKGRGIGVTYAGVIPGLRIDYILGSKDIKFNSYTSPKSKLSDHYPIISKFEIKRGAQK